MLPHRFRCRIASAKTTHFLEARASSEQLTKKEALSDNSMTSYMVSKKMMEVNPTHSIMTELIKKASADNLRRR